MTHGSVGLALKVAAAWDRLLLAGLPARLAAEERTELSGELADHAARARAVGAGGAGLAVRICSRVLRGAPADVAWRRRTQRRLAQRHRGVAHWSSEPVFLVLWLLGAVLVVATLQLLAAGALPPLVGSLAALALLDRWLRRRDAAGYEDPSWRRPHPIPGLRTDFRETGDRQRPPRR